MIKNGKYFYAPQNKSCDFKELFRNLTSSGAGRPVDSNGFVEGPWTPELLAEAISQIDANLSGTELRTVQVWFQDNDKGISYDNIRWLARIFGCDDPEATSKWQSELIDAQTRMKAKKNEKRRLTSKSNHPEIAEPVAREASSTEISPSDENDIGVLGFSLAQKSESVFNSRNPLSLPIAIWAMGGGLWFLAYINSVHSITYSPMDGVDKQVGLFWAPSWTIDRMLFVSLFLMIVTELLSFWKEDGRLRIDTDNSRALNKDQWGLRVEAFSLSFWSILTVCLTVIFLFQWVGVYFSALVKGKAGTAMIDWILVAIERPEVTSASTAIILAGFANLYSCFVYWCYFVGLLLLYMIARDFRHVYGTKESTTGHSDWTQALEIGDRIMTGVFCCIAFGILAATCIKLNAVYLISDAENIGTWLFHDALTALGIRNEPWAWLDKNPSALLTSFLVLFVTCFVFFACLFQIHWTLEMTSVEQRTSKSETGTGQAKQLRLAKISWTKMTIVILLLATSFVLIGQFIGFSILLFGSASVAFFSLVETSRSLGRGFSNTNEAS